MMLVLAFLPALMAAVHTRRFRDLVTDLESALWREGVNLNPGRGYALTRYAKELRHAG